MKLKIKLFTLYIALCLLFFAQYGIISGIVMSVLYGTFAYILAKKVDWEGENKKNE